MGSFAAETNEIMCQQLSQASAALPKLCPYSYMADKMQRNIQILKMLISETQMWLLSHQTSDDKCLHLVPRSSASNGQTDAGFSDSS